MGQKRWENQGGSIKVEQSKSDNKFETIKGDNQRGAISVGQSTCVNQDREKKVGESKWDNQGGQ